MGYGQNLNVPNFTTGELIKNLFKLIKRVFLHLKKGLPFVGYDIKILDHEGKSLEELGPNLLGRIVVKLPLPPGELNY